MGDERERAVANVLGVVLLVAVVLTAVTVLAGASAQTMTEQSRAIAGETAGSDLSTLAEASIAVAGGGHERKRVFLSGTDSSAVTAYEQTDDGRMTVAIGSDGSGWRTIADVPLGAVLAETGSAAVAMQGGGVWRVRDGDPASAEVLRAPPISVIERGDTTLTVPIYRLRSGDRVRGDADVTVTNQRPLYDRLYVPGSENVRITVSSRFAEAWERVFEQSFPERETDVSVAGGQVTVVYRGTGDRYLHGAVHRVEIDDARGR